MNEAQVEDLLRSIGCWKSGHFVLRNPAGNPRHSGDYVDNDPLMANERALGQIGQAIAEQVIEAGLKVRVVTGPAQGGLRLAEAVKEQLQTFTGGEIRLARNKKTVGSVHAGFDFDKHTTRLRSGSILVVEDTVTSGGSITKILDLIREAGGSTVAVACVLNRGGVTSEKLGVPALLSLLNRDLPVFDPGLNPGDFAHSSCPLCRTGVQIEFDVGNGKWFVDKYGQPPKSL